ncbi:unnamed protein product [Mytilus coruscus]|uniref:Mab-21-like HhH/H2TH-like domain-containing protein n=1 Tax=Mytilus coruscus TaxID=42192 RepID=A0A6J8ASG6_MYTCO|nr:unnamed protein product [Mytilus coruscus]
MLTYLGEVKNKTSQSNSSPNFEVYLNNLPKQYQDICLDFINGIQESQTIDPRQFYRHSLDIYRYLLTECTSENRVKAIRTIYKVLDDSTKISPVYTNISSGSKGEGLNVPGGDYDLMTILEQIQVNHNCSVIEEDRPILLFDNRYSYPGFTHLKIGQNRFSKELFTAWGENTFYGPLISNNRFKNYFLSRYRDSNCKIHGPCISDSRDEVDHLFCFRAMLWPDVADSWLIRNRSSLWPPTDVILNSSRGIVHKALFRLLNNKLSYYTKGLYMLLFCYANQVFPQNQHMVFHKENKMMYSSYRQCMAHFLIGTKVDAITGWLLLASYFYKMGKPLYTLKITEMILAKSREDKILIADGYHEDVMMKYLEEVAATKWNHNLSFLNCMNSYCVDMLYNIPWSTLNLEELSPDVNVEFNIIPPVIYVHVLRFVCYNDNGNISLREREICDIIKTCRNNCFLGDWRGRANAYAILAKIYKTMNDDKSANYWKSHSFRYFRNHPKHNFRQIP